MPENAEPLAAQVTAVVIHYQTSALLEAAVRSFRDAYQDVPVLIVDNGSDAESRAAVEALVRSDSRATSARFLSKNCYHGPAMHLAMEDVSTPFVYFFDSDTVTRRTGFLEPMLKMLSAEDRNYGIGKIVRVDRRGFARPDGPIPVPASAFMMLRRECYFRLPPFIHHGLPVLKNCIAAAAKGYRLIDFPIEEYVDHIGRGTAERFGYGLGLRSRLDYLLHRLGL